LSGTTPRLTAAAGLLVLAAGSPGFAQSSFPLPPEPPAKMPSATTLPSFRSHPPLGPEAPPPTAPGTQLPSMRGGELGPESALPRPPTTNLPSFRQETYPQAVPPERPRGRTIMVPNGNGTSTLINPDGTVTTVPTPPR
jgi:hypothetical protein